MLVPLKRIEVVCTSAVYQADLRCESMEKLFFSLFAFVWCFYLTTRREVTSVQVTNKLTFTYLCVTGLAWRVPLPNFDILSVLQSKIVRWIVSRQETSSWYQTTSSIDSARISMEYSLVILFSANAPSGVHLLDPPSSFVCNSLASPPLQSLSSLKLSSFVYLEFA